MRKLLLRPQQSPLWAELIYDSEAYQAKINEHVKAAELTDAPLVLGSVGKDIIVPDEGAEDSGLGTYRVSSSGIKLYYDETVFPEELMLTLEKYFTSPTGMN